jgi:hypothetical protein
LINGVLADQIGVPLTVQINALILLASASLLFIRFPFIRNKQ